MIVIADDLTGAAEMAGVAWRHGCRVELTFADDNHLPYDVGEAFLREKETVLVVATDTRSLGTDDAVHLTRALTEALKSHCRAEDIVVFKKTDSALRGHIVEETRACMQQLGRRNALLLPQNPSKERVIRNGVYEIKGTPLHLTPFAHDPEYPASSSFATTLLPGAARLSATDLLEEGVYIADATNGEQLRHQLLKAGKDTLLAGAADLFEAFLTMTDGDARRPTRKPGKRFYASALVVCGSTQSQEVPLHAPECPMPDDVFHGASPAAWYQTLSDTYRTSHALVMSVGRRENRGPAYARRLRATMAEAVGRLIDEQTPVLLIVEGGATAAAIVKQTGWRRLHVDQELAPGVVMLVHAHTPEALSSTYFLLKPGSYPWHNVHEYIETGKLTE